MSRKLRIVTVVGARPQYIKLLPLHRELANLQVDHRIINTGQHYDFAMAGVFFQELKLPKPAANLAVGSGIASEMTAKIIDGCSRAFRKLAPDLVAVIGDTNSTLGGAIAAKQSGLPLAHIEAGLRCGDMSVPEELNRVVTDQISDLLFCPTPQSVANLKGEGIRKRVALTGDVLYDVLVHAKPTTSFRNSFLNKLQLAAGEYFLATIHRADSVDNRENLSKLVTMLTSLKIPVLFPVHPRTLKNLRKFGLLTKLSDARTIRMIEPLGYRESLAAISGSRMVLTDSGGLQREAYFLRVPTLLLREVTEWVEINRGGGSKIIGFDKALYLRGISSRNFRFDNRNICRAGASRRIARLMADFVR